MVLIIGLGVWVIWSPPFFLSQKFFRSVLRDLILIVFLEVGLSMEFLSRLPRIHIVEGVHLSLWLHLLVV